MKDLYKLSRQECVELTKRNLVDMIYSNALVEGIAVTFPETQELFEGRTVSGLSIDDTIKINNLKHAWQFVFDTLDYPLDFLYLRQLNQYINSGLMSDAGSLRNYDVGIGGTNWKPDLPDVDKIKETVESIQSIGCATERAIKMMLYVMRAQMFSDGNKRVAQLAANQILIQNGAGYLRIAPEDRTTFFDKLIRFYETGIYDEIETFVYKNCIKGKVPVKEFDLPELNEDMFKKNSKKKKPGRNISDNLCL